MRIPVSMQRWSLVSIEKFDCRSFAGKGCHGQADEIGWLLLLANVSDRHQSWVEARSEALPQNPSSSPMRGFPRASVLTHTWTREETVHPRLYPLFPSVVSGSRVARMEEGGAAPSAMHWRMVRRENLVDHNLEYHTDASGPQGPFAFHRAARE